MAAHSRPEPDHEAMTRSRLAAIVTSSADAIIGENLEGIITDWNPAAERLYGYTAEEIIGQHLSILAPPEERAAVARHVAHVQAGESIESLEAVRWTKDGRRIDVSLTIYPVYDDAGQIIATSAIARDISLVKAHERALAASEERFRVAFQDAPIGVTVTAPDLQPLQVNRAVCAILGYSEVELLTTTFQTITHPHDVEATRALVERALAGEITTYEQEKRYVRKDGQIVWVQLNGSLVRDDTGAPRYFVSHLQDITERKVAEAERAAIHHNTQQVLERITDGFYAMDPQWCFTYVNEAAERLLGRRREELLGKSIWEEFSPAAEPLLYATYRRAMAEEITHGLDYYFASVDRWFEVRVYPSRDGLSVFFHDVSERIRAEAALRESEARRGALLAALPDMVFRLDSDGTIVDYKAHRLDDLVLPPESFLGRTVSETLPADAAVTIEAGLARVLASGDLQTTEYELDLAHGRRSFEARLVAAGPAEVLAVIRDVTERKQRDEELQAALLAAQAANRAKNLFLAMMSHELRTPMQAVLGYADLLLAGGDDALTTEQVGDVQTIRRGAERMTALVSQMLDLSRLEAGRMELAAVPVDLETIVAQVRQDVAPQAAVKGLDLKIDLPPDLAPARGDAVGVHQVLLNLAGNAVKFTERGSVRITARVTGNEVVVTVSDTGIGIPKAAVPHLFEEFRQVDTGMTRRHEGAGLGLAIARMLAEQMGGSIRVTSRPGFGSAFSLHLPAFPDDRIGHEGAARERS